MRWLGGRHGRKRRIRWSRWQRRNVGYDGRRRRLDVASHAHALRATQSEIRRTGVRGTSKIYSCARSRVIVLKARASSERCEKTSRVVEASSPNHQQTRVQKVWYVRNMSLYDFATLLIARWYIITKLTAKYAIIDHLCGCVLNERWLIGAHTHMCSWFCREGCIHDNCSGRSRHDVVVYVIDANTCKFCECIKVGHITRKNTRTRHGAHK